METPLKAFNDNSNGDLILEGTCAVFGQMNDNHRIYEKAEYLPHLSYLREKIKRGQLFGELDHPQSFDVSLKNVSHIVEALDYDEGTNSVKIRVRVLDTPSGNIVKNIVKSGGKVSISSRAAGQVLESKKVKLHRIFTYDLVAEGGFWQSILNSVNESAGGSDFQLILESMNLLRDSSIVNKLTDISESLNFGESVKLYKINNTDTQVPENNEKQMANESAVSQAQLDTYSKVVKKKMETLQEGIARNNAAIQALSENLDNPLMEKLVEFTNYLAGEMEKIVEYSNYLSLMMNKGIFYTEHVAEKINNVIDFSDYLAEMTEKNIQFSGYLGEKLNQAINYSEYTGAMTEKSIRFGNYLAQMLDKGICYTEHVAERASQGINFSNYLSESLNAAIKYSEYLGTNLQKGIAYSEYIAETMNQKDTANVNVRARKLLSDVAQLNESVDTSAITETSAVEEVVAAVENVITSIKSNSANAVLESRYPFLKLLSADNKQKFYALDPDIKTAIVETLRGAIFFNEKDVINIMEAVMNKQEENTPTYLRFIPEKYKAIYEKMNDSEKNWVAAKASTFIINTPYQTKNFWDSLDLRGVNERISRSEDINNTPINENQGKEGFISVDKVNEGLRGYSNSYVQSLIRR